MHSKAAANTLLVCFAVFAIAMPAFVEARSPDTSFWQPPEEPEGDEGRRRR